MSQIDWAATGAWMQAWAGFSAAAAVIWAAHKGSSSFRAWVRQRQADRRISAAEQILIVVYRAKEIFPAIRSPFLTVGEMNEAAKLLGLSEMRSQSGVEKRSVTGQIHITRIVNNSEFWAALWACLPHARAFFGRDFESKIRQIWVLRGKIAVAAQMYPSIDPDRDRALGERLETDMWEGLGDANDLGDRIRIELQDIVDAAERMLLPVISDEDWRSRE